MDEEQGKVIDGTARARQWRRSRANPPTASDDREPHAAAPKSIASSLLVPGSMLDDLAVPSAEEASPRERPQDGALAGGGELQSDGREAFAAGVDENLFLTPNAAVVAPPKRSRHRATAPALVRHAGALSRRVVQVRMSAPRLKTVRPRRLVVAVGLITTVAITTGLVVHSTTTPSSSPARASGHAAVGAGLDRLTARGLAAIGKFAEAVHAKPRERTRHARPHARPAVHRHSSAQAPPRQTAAVSATSSYTPPPTASSVTSGSGGSSSGAAPPSGGSGSASTPAAHPSSSSSGGSTSAFGPKGALGPGSSPNG
jgi:hypothetical protein